MLATTIQITNNPPHTTHTQETLRLAAQATTTTSGGRSHGVEREPDSVLICKNFYAQPKTRTHTHHPPWAANTCRHKKTTQHNPQAMPNCSPQTGLPRKEVIQPHLPVRLPCYDFVPIANPTFDHSPRKSG